MHRMYMDDGSICGLFNFGGMFGSSYISISTRIYAITCVSRKGPMCGVKF